MNSKIKALYLVVLLVLVFTKLSAQDTTSFRFTLFYAGKNVYVQNPVYRDSLFCTCLVKVNQKNLLVQPASSSYEIDLSGYKLNDTLNIQIIHYKSCIPKVLNLYIGHRRLAVFKSFTNWGQTLVCTYKKGTDQGVFYVEHFEYNSWVNKAELAPVKGDTMFTVNIHPFSGSNKYRLRYIAPNGEVCYSMVRELDFGVMKPKVKIDLKAEMIYFSEEVEYHILDNTGTCLLEGFAKEENISGLYTGVFYLQVDNKITKFVIRK